MPQSSKDPVKKSLSCTAEREKQCLFYLGLNVDMFMKVIFGGKKISSSVEISILSV